jgi:hypothetical protein
VIGGNLFGTDKTGAVALMQGGNRASGTGLYLDSDSSGTIASSQPDIRFNIFSGHASDGIVMKGVFMPGVQSNLIGLGVGLPSPVIGNTLAGIVITNAATNLVSQNGSIFLNTITGSGSDGISVQQNVNGSPTGNNLASNVIYQNAGLGINLMPTGEAGSTVTPNDNLDADSGPNGLQNFPVINSAVTNGSGAVVVQFTLNSAPAGNPFNTFNVTAYASPSCSAKGYGEGQYLGGNSGSIMTDASGNVSGTITVPSGTTGWTAGSVVTLLAHDVFLNNTSEFSACMTIQGAVVTPTKLAFVQQPTNAAAGAAISPSVTVQLQDAGSNPVSQAGVSVTLSLASGTGALSGTATQATNAAGLATFAGLSVNLVGTKTLSAASGVLTGATSSSFVISAGAAASIVVSGGSPQQTTVATAFGSPLQVTVTDSLGNPVTGASVVFTPPASGASAAITGSPATTNANGIASVTATANGTTGSYSVAASTGTLPAVQCALTNLAAPAQTNNVPALGSVGLVALSIGIAAVGCLLASRIG